MADLHIVILAAGKGTRMKSALPKVLHPLAGVPLVEHVLRSASALNPLTTTIVIGHGGDEVRQALKTRTYLKFVVQSPQLGTGHALMQAEPALAAERGIVVLLYADVPLLSAATLTRLIERHRASRAAATVLTAEMADPFGYGRIVRDAEGDIARIVEERDASAEERAIGEINSGIYVFSLAPLFDSLRRLATDNSQGEYYLTDLVAMYRQAGLKVETLRLENAIDIRGVNSRVDLADLTAIVRSRKNQSVMLDGATLDDPATTYIDADVNIGTDTTIGPGVVLSGHTTIGARCHIHSGARLTDATIGDDVSILDGTVIVKSTVASRASLGPYAHLRPESHVGEGAHVGNFVELKKTTMGAGAKAGHLAYLGDATIGDRVNVGAGVITCNYDGVRKHRTTVESDVFVGSDSQLVAPVTIGKGAYVAAGSTVTEDVPADALAIARSRQVNKRDWKAKRKAD